MRSEFCNLCLAGGQEEKNYLKGPPQNWKKEKLCGKVYSIIKPFFDFL
jgi:hypothetical protein